MPDNIICVRIAQRALQTDKASLYERFPFERVYLCPHRLKPQLKGLFRYSLSLQLDTPLLKALNHLVIHTKKETPIWRDDVRTEGVKLGKNEKNAFKQHIGDPAEWLMIVPTHAKTIYKDKKKHKGPIASELGYLISKVITYGHNAQIRMPRITLHTPYREIPILCGICKNNLDLHGGNCLPGRPSCASRIGITLKLDTHHARTTSKSIAETGGSE